MKTGSKFLIIGCISLALAVIFGAFGAHALKTSLEASGLNETYEIAVQYHFYHSFGLLMIGLLKIKNVVFDIRLIGWTMLAGIILFSGSLYVLSIFEARSLGIITPFGGMLFIISWVVLAYRIYNDSAR